MILNDEEIQESGIITPFKTNLVQSHSYDCTLDSTILVQQLYCSRRHKDDINEGWVEIDLVEKGSYILKPQQFILANTIEYFKLPADIIGFVQGKSSIGRDGLQVENAGLIDPLFEGQITLELYNMSNWDYKIEAFKPICQVYFEKTKPAKIKPYNKFGKYMYQTGPVCARSSK